MFKNKNDYSVIIVYTYGGVERFYKMEYVHNVLSLVKWLDNSHIYRKWKHINVYNRRSGQFIKQYKKGEFVPPKPKF